VLWAVPLGVPILVIGPGPTLFGNSESAVGAQPAVGYFLLAVTAVLGVVMVRSVTARQMALMASVRARSMVVGSAGST
jgi:hypothetical protein